MDTSVAWATVANPEPSTQHVLRPAAVRRHRLVDLAHLAGAELLGADGTVTGITAGSADVRPGDLFAALPGASGHGARYVRDAVAAGAVAVLTDADGAAQLAGSDLPLLVCPDPRAVLGAVSAQVYGRPSGTLRVLGVTGTSGKTTTTSLVRAGLAAAGVSTGLIGTVGVFFGAETVKMPFTTPEAPQLQALLATMAERGITTVAMEVSSHALRLGRVSGTEFAVGAFTNLSQDHLDFHADMEDYFAAKALLFDGRAAREIVVIDDEWGVRLVTAETVTVSGRPDQHNQTARDADKALGLLGGTGDARADWCATDLTVAADGSTSFTVHGPGVRFAAGCRIPGLYNVANTLLAFAILAAAEVDVVAVAPALAVAQVRGRMERVDGDQPFLAVVDYSHKPAGVTGALEALRPLTPGRLIIVLGCGGDRDRGKRPVMGEVAARSADVLIVTDDNPRTEDPAAIRAAMLAGARTVPSGEAAEIREIGDRHAAIETAIGMAQPGDTVLVAGKGHETGQQVGTVMLSFDDVSVVQQSLVRQGYSLTTAGPGSATQDVTNA